MLLVLFFSQCFAAAEAKPHFFPDRAHFILVSLSSPKKLVKVLTFVFNLDFFIILCYYIYNGKFGFFILLLNKTV